MSTDESICFDVCFALEASPGGRRVETSRQAVLAAGLVPGFGFECAIGIMRTQGALQLARVEMGFEPDRTAFVEDLERAGPFAVFEETAEKEAAVFVQNRDRPLQVRIDVVGSSPGLTVRIGLPIGSRSRCDSVGVVPLTPECTHALGCIAGEDARVRPAGRER